MFVMKKVEETSRADAAMVKRFAFFRAQKERRGGLHSLQLTTAEQHQRGKLALELCCWSSQNKTRPLEVREVGGQNQTCSL